MKAGFDVRCPKCGKIYEPWTDGYLTYHDCPGCGYDGFVYVDEVVEDDAE